MNYKEIIRAEIERRKSLADEQKNNGYFFARSDAYMELLNFIDSMTEEPVGDDLDDAARKYSREWYAKRIGTRPKCTGCYAHIEDAFTDGAKWQKEQLLKDATLGEIHERSDGTLGWTTVMGTTRDYRNYLLSHFKNGDRVKLIIIKDE